MRQTSDISPRALENASERERLLAAGGLHWFHWAVVVASILLTVGAFYFSKSQVDLRVEARFARESDNVIELISERMQKYEDALWGGVGAMHAMAGSMTHAEWLAFSETLHLERKYPGINGIGVIHQVPAAELATFTEAQRSWRPDFQAHPPVKVETHWPITYIEPIENNVKAVGLDMAHETNRLTAVERARDTGGAAMTGPIVLVQDAQKTPGFLLFVPFNQGETKAEIGLIYAPFVMRELMDGTLDRSRREVGIRITDGDDVLFDEHTASDRRFDPEPLYSRTATVDLYGRTWRFDIRSDQTFRFGAGSAQPYTILIGGLAIDALLLLLFVSLSRANRRAVAYADRATQELQERSASLERSNQDLEQFAYVASHDLQEPLRTIAAFSQLLEEDLAQTLPDESRRHLDFIIEGAQRMQILVDDLLDYARAARAELPVDRVDMNAVVRVAQENLRMAIEESGASIECDDLDDAVGDSGLLTHVFQNLVSNAIKFRNEEPPLIKISSEPGDAHVTYAVADDGIGIPPDMREVIFSMLRRLHSRKEYEGSGVGLALCMRVVQRHGGRIWVESEPGRGSTFYFTLRRASLEDGSDA